MTSPAAPSILDWAEKHRPRTLSDIAGNKAAVEEIRAWAAEWTDGAPKERALVLAGDPGVGKTSAAHALARDMGWGVIEMNASDTRNEEVIRRIAGTGATHRAFGADGSFSAETKGRQLVILDEADNLFGNQDRGGMKAIQDTIREAKQPIVLICNDLYELQKRGASLKTLARTVKFGKVHSSSIPTALRRIAQIEGITLEAGVEKALAERAGGDLRSAVNDFQALATGRTSVALADVEALGRRDTTGDVWGLLGKVFYGRDIDEARKAAWGLDETPENIAVWIDENLPVMYTDRRDLAEGYQYLSKASVMLGRVQRRQQYSLWSYATELMTAGVASAKRERPAGARFQFPSWLRRQSSFKGVRELRGRTAEKVGAVLHTSKKRAWQDIFPYLRSLMQQDEQFAIWATWQFDLEADELAFLLEAKPTSAEVKRIVEAAAKTYSIPARAVSAGAFGRFGGTDTVEDDDEPPTKNVLAAAEDDEDEAPAKPAAKPAAKESGPSQAKLEESSQKSEGKAAPAEPKRQRNLMDF